MSGGDKVWGDKPLYFKQPLRWIRYHAHVNTALFTAVALGVSAPICLLLTPLRRKYLYPDHEPIPLVYPLPNRPRDKNLTGYDDA
ncbi:NADH-ubiquinone oxidoreductase 9 subunit [Candida viswanathii]|uniref:NADH-ubiquinone oxidoreductase 9 subunit n=1 Tax=Candida viswanathii TaxID=5486 RepID=A0A367Y9D6_9ASCO|nr:NADH-ubiquinone oxidoreductase 9 subunit [Candida viswanathii]